ncbi:serine/threonine-protein kinase PEPKR2-like protein, partial [Tanacetum coccineum]
MSPSQALFSGYSHHHSATFEKPPPFVDYTRGRGLPSASSKFDNCLQDECFQPLEVLSSTQRFVLSVSNVYTDQHSVYQETDGDTLLARDGAVPAVDATPNPSRVSKKKAKRSAALWKHMINASADIAVICYGCSSLRKICDESTMIQTLPVKSVRWVVSGGGFRAWNYCHDMGVVHLDVKPENTHLTFSGNTKLADFGMEVVLLNGLLVVENLAATGMTASHAVGRLSGQYGFGDDITKQE